jgi:hypothetical protein
MYGFTQEQHDWAENQIKYLVCASHLVESVMQANAEYPHSEISEFSYEDIENGFFETCFECGSDNIQVGVCNDCHSKELEPQYYEIFEWWIVPNDWLFQKLKNQGQPTLEAGGLNFWGRMTTGQAIILDGVFQRIKINLEQELK